MFFVSLSQAQDYITAGACLALGLRFAGSANSDAFDCLYETASRTFMKIISFAGTAAVVSVCMHLCFTVCIYLNLHLEEIILKHHSYGKCCVASPSYT